MNNILQMGGKFEGKNEATGAACRRLFEDEESNGKQVLGGERSPQFKHIWLSTPYFWKISNENTKYESIRHIKTNFLFLFGINIYNPTFIIEAYFFM